MTLDPPPPDLPAKPPTARLLPGDRLVRFYRPEHGPWDLRRAYGPLPWARFDHHRLPAGEDPERSVWYAARSLLGATAEAFGNLGFIDRGAGRRVVVARVRSPILLLDLVGVAARGLGLDQRIATSTEYPTCQAWARAVYERYPHLAGIRWRGRQAGAIAVVLTDRADLTSLEATADFDLAHPAVWPRIARAAGRCRRLGVVGDPANARP